ncbi:MAG: autoinducer binding domain-containing protein [Alphaproteobacteria bacterium]|nr:autoinducer binding domain-containing protein [Alphaproteobacteria bacterium]
MLDQNILQVFERIANCNTVEDLHEIVVEAVLAFGYDYVTFLTLPSPGQTVKDSILFDTRPKKFIESHRRKDYLTRETAIKELKRSLATVTLGDLRDMPTMTLAHRKLFEEASELGIVDGLIVPVVTAGGNLGVFSPSGRAPDLGPIARTTAELIGTCAHQRVLRLSLISIQSDPNFEPLSRREREVLQLVASGKTDKNIAQALKIEAATVRNQIEQAKLKLGVTKRTQALIMALKRGEIGL